MTTFGFGAFIWSRIWDYAGLPRGYTHQLGIGRRPIIFGIQGFVHSVEDQLVRFLHVKKSERSSAYTASSHRHDHIDIII
jgi:hypothetical protein